MGALYLTVLDGPDEGREARADGELVVGRDDGVELMLADSSVSRRHALIRPQGDTAVVEDLGSSNGTYVNEQPIAEPCRVADGDVIRIGSSSLALRVGPTEARPLSGDETEILTPPDSTTTLS